MLRVAWVMGIIGVTLFALEMPRSFAQSPDPGAYYNGTVTTCTNTVFSLSPPFSLTIGPNGHVISMQFTVAVIGPFDIPVDIPIASDGSFSGDFTPLNFSSGPIVARAHVEGRFEGNGMSGSYRFAVNIDVLGSASCAGEIHAQRSTQPPPTAHTDAHVRRATWHGRGRGVKPSDVQPVALPRALRRDGAPLRAGSADAKVAASRRVLSANATMPYNRSAFGKNQSLGP